jgi:hypothetical protein
MALENATARERVFAQVAGVRTVAGVCLESVRHAPTRANKSCYSENKGVFRRRLPEESYFLVEALCGYLHSSRIWTSFRPWDPA